MKKFLIPLFLTILILSACATETPQATPTVAPVTDTSAPATATAPATETTVPTAEAVVPTDTAVVENTSASVSFANQVFPIINTYCVECHGGVRIREGLNVTTYDGLVAGSVNGPVIVAGNANESLFVELIAAGEMPQRGPAPSTAELQLIIDWINQGALNN